MHIISSFNFPYNSGFPSLFPNLLKVKHLGNSLAAQPLHNHAFLYDGLASARWPEAAKLVSFWLQSVGREPACFETQWHCTVVYQQRPRITQSGFKYSNLFLFFSTSLTLVSQYFYPLAHKPGRKGPGGWALRIIFLWIESIRVRLISQADALRAQMPQNSDGWSSQRKIGFICQSVIQLCAVKCWCDMTSGDMLICFLVPR